MDHILFYQHFCDEYQSAQSKLRSKPYLKDNIASMHQTVLRKSRFIVYTLGSRILWSPINLAFCWMLTKEQSRIKGFQKIPKFLPTLSNLKYPYMPILYNFCPKMETVINQTSHSHPKHRHPRPQLVQIFSL